MNPIIIDYFHSLLHPFEKSKSLRQAKELSFQSEESSSFLEYASVAWIFVIIETFYVFLGVYFFSFVEFDQEAPQFFSLSWRLQGLSLFQSLVWVAIFPLMAFLYTKFWTYLIRFFAELFKSDQDLDHSALKDVTNMTLCSHAFLVIPVFGPMVRHVSAFIYLYAGLREYLQFTKAQTLVILLSPLILFLMFIFLMTSSIIFLVFSFL